MLNQRTIFGVVVLLCAISSIALADQPYMRAARTDLQQARARLQNATSNKGGHRVKALEHVNRAIGLVNQGIACDRRHNHAVRSLGEASMRRSGSAKHAGCARSPATSERQSGTRQLR